MMEKRHEILKSWRSQSPSAQIPSDPYHSQQAVSPGKGLLKTQNGEVIWTTPNGPPAFLHPGSHFLLLFPLSLEARMSRTCLSAPLLVEETVGREKHADTEPAFPLVLKTAWR